MKKLRINLDLETIASEITKTRSKEQIKEILKRHIRLACECYLEYKNSPTSLYHDYPLYGDPIDDIYQREIEIISQAEEAGVWNGENHFLEKYNGCLFREIFKEVLTNE